MKPIKPAHGLVCCLIYCGDGQYRIRVYDEHKLGIFEDHDIRISDLFFEIRDEDAWIYEDENGHRYIDHSPETLGEEKCPRCGDDWSGTSCGIPNCGWATGVEE